MSCFKILLSIIYEAHSQIDVIDRTWNFYFLETRVPTGLMQVHNYIWESSNDDTEFLISQDVNQRAFATSLGFPSQDWHRSEINMPETTSLQTSFAFQELYTIYSKN